MLIAVSHKPRIPASPLLSHLSSKSLKTISTSLCRRITPPLRVRLDICRQTRKTTMLNVRALNELLTQNVDHKVFLRWFIMTPNGSLMAYTLPANMKELRDQVALVSISWKENLERKDNEQFEPDHSQGGPSDPPNRTIKPDTLRTLTVEFDNRNLIIKYLQPKLLLVLEGGVPPGRKRPLKVSAEGPDDARYPSDDVPDSGSGGFALGSSVGSKASMTPSNASAYRLGVLHIQRRKMDIMAQAIKQELSGFEMPDDPTNKFF